MKLLTVCLTILLISGMVIAQDAAKKEEGLVAKGMFVVKMTPQNAEGEPFGRYAFDKEFTGDLVGKSQGRMLSAETPVKGSAGYVAFESVTGTLNGKRGSFVLQHKGTMRNEQYNMEVTVLPDSGTEELKGISGSMTIKIESGKHFYVLEYSLGQQ